MFTYDVSKFLAILEPLPSVSNCQHSATPSKFEIYISSVFEGNLEKSPHVNFEGVSLYTQFPRARVTTHLVLAPNFDSFV